MSPAMMQAAGKFNHALPAMKRQAQSGATAHLS